MQVLSKEMISGDSSRKDKVKSGKEKKLTTCALVKQASIVSNWDLLPLGTSGIPCRTCLKDSLPKGQKVTGFYPTSQPIII